MVRGGLAVVAGVACALVVALAADARGGASAWTKLPNGPLENSYEASLARTPDQTLHVVFERNGGITQDIWDVPVRPNGVVGASSPIVTGWPLLNNPAVVSTSAGLRAFFGGIRSTSPTETNKSLNTATAGPNGVAWELQVGDPAPPSSAYQAPVSASATRDGTFVEAWSTTFGLDFHFGTTPQTPNVRVPGNCCYYDPGIAVDSASGQTVLGWYSNENAATAGSVAGQGMFLQEIGPSGLVGERRLAPGSATADGKSAAAPMYRTPVTGRLGAPGVFLVYGAGYPTFQKVDVMRFGAGAPAIQIPAQDAVGANVAAAPQGRLWVFWRRDNVIYVTRTNKAVTQIEPVSVVAPPAGTDTIWRLNGEGSLGPLELVANVQTGEASFWIRRVLPRLSLHASALGSRQVRFVVTDAGDPVAGAKVRLRGRNATTNGSGVATVRTTRGRGTATATKSGYLAAAAPVIVR